MAGEWMRLTASCGRCGPEKGHCKGPPSVLLRAGTRACIIPGSRKPGISSSDREAPDSEDSFTGCERRMRSVHPNGE